MEVELGFIYSRTRWGLRTRATGEERCLPTNRSGDFQSESVGYLDIHGNSDLS